eukprot:TRINITY_DN1582_c0_g1_i1.p1 TRINITY_DN1582_c0_g1~~TRINITY_DN1582_c0_g1_i1.p1  ORF type:complete len:356 (-),score=98.19 TRINITY_DN1582_c0_g1_i1:856-1923(-)
MGCCKSKPSNPDDEVSHARSKKIERELEVERDRLAREIKMLLLGAGESGKSTILKQMKLIYGSGFSRDEYSSYKDVIFFNVVKSMQSLIAGAEKLGITIQNEETMENIALVKPLTGKSDFNAAIGAIIKQIWADQDIQKAFESRNQFQLIDSAAYYFENVERIAAADYAPIEQDILRSRVATTGVTETTFTIDANIFRVVDVGGQRSERKKWMSCFDDVTCVIFVVALSEFDQVLFEDESANRMAESMQLFKEICDNKWFEHTPIILFLNKQDLFKKKLEQGKQLTVAFPDYQGGNNFPEATGYIQDRFKELNKIHHREIFIKLTCATDTDNMKFVLNAVKTIILQRKLEAIGFM